MGMNRESREALEVRSGARHRARQFAARGHSVHLIAPQLVAHFRKSGVRGKNDAADGATICRAEPGFGPSRERCVPGQGQAAFVARWARAPVRRTYSLSSAWHSSAMNPVVSCNLLPLPR